MNEYKRYSELWRQTWQIFCSTDNVIGHKSASSSQLDARYYNIYVKTHIRLHFNGDKKKLLQNEYLISILHGTTYT